MMNGEPPQILCVKKMIRDVSFATILWFITVYLVIRYTNNPQPMLDIATTYMALLANWYLAKKYINGFIIWIFTDILLAYMFFIQHMYWSMVLYIILIEFARQGQFAWEKSLKTD
jgi:nicotinamide mononucleotide transporter